MNAEINKKQMRYYLLGALSEDEQVELEAAYFADNEKFEQVWELENQLVDEYVRGRLVGDERMMFERNYLASPKHKERVITARSLLQEADALLVEENPFVEKVEKSSAPWWARWKQFLSPPQLAWGGLAALLLLTFCGWWLFKNSSFEQTALSTPSPSISPTPSAVPSTSNAPSPTPTTTQPTPRPELPRSPSPSARTVEPAVLAFVLLGQGTRQEGQSQPLMIPRDTQQVRVEMKLDNETYQRYRVQLRNVDNGATFQVSAQPPTANKKSLAALIPAAKLAPGDYILTLSGQNSTADATEINRYFLRVTRK